VILCNANPTGLIDAANFATWGTTLVIPISIFSLICTGSTTIG